MKILLGRMITPCATLALAATLGSGCAMPKPSGFLGNYSRLAKVNDSTWRYVDKPCLATYDKYMIASVKVLVKSYNSTPLSASEQEQTASRFRAIIAKALAGHCELVDKPSGKTAEIRAAITVAYPVGPSLALGLEGEIVDAYSGRQLAAVMKFQAGAPQLEAGTSDLSNNVLGGGWWNQHSAVWIMEDWANQLRKAMDQLEKAGQK